MIKINDKSYLPIDEYAIHKSVTEQTIRNWIKEKKISSRRLMGRLIIEL